MGCCTGNVWRWWWKCDKHHTFARWKMSISQQIKLCCEMEIFHLATYQNDRVFARWKISISQQIKIRCEMEIFHLATSPIGRTIARWKISISQRINVRCEMEIFHLATVCALTCPPPSLYSTHPSRHATKRNPPSNPCMIG